MSHKKMTLGPSYTRLGGALIFPERGEFLAVELMLRVYRVAADRKALKSRLYSDIHHVG
jgi:hypothetical protein